MNLQEPNGGRNTYDLTVTANSRRPPKNKKRTDKASARLKCYLELLEDFNSADKWKLLAVSVCGINNVDNVKYKYCNRESP